LDQASRRQTAPEQPANNHPHDFASLAYNVDAKFLPGVSDATEVPLSSGNTADGAAM